MAGVSEAPRGMANVELDETSLANLFKTWAASSPRYLEVSAAIKDILALLATAPQSPANLNENRTIEVYTLAAYFGRMVNLYLKIVR